MGEKLSLKTTTLPGWGYATNARAGWLDEETLVLGPRFREPADLIWAWRPDRQVFVLHDLKQSAKFTGLVAVGDAVVVLANDATGKQKHFQIFPNDQGGVTLELDDEVIAPSSRTVTRGIEIDNTSDPAQRIVWPDGSVESWARLHALLRREKYFSRFSLVRVNAYRQRGLGYLLVLWHHYCSASASIASVPGLLKT